MPGGLAGEAEPYPFLGRGTGGAGRASPGVGVGVGVGVGAGVGLGVGQRGADHVGAGGRLVVFKVDVLSKGSADASLGGAVVHGASLKGRRMDGVATVGGGGCESSSSSSSKRRGTKE